MRLIDADALSHKFFEIGCHITKIHPMDVMNIISEQPTAYDVEKVVAELEELKKINSEAYFSLVHLADKAKNIGAESAYGNAIDIVKRGGTE